ncbi:CBS domain-containing protein [Nonomuraea sp. MG754425]|uniref:CBS domain-containing protein n=1 Tax=Nonomuraea sp. MG754425 TaxID=2570319 RepID=UPI001F440A6C|nr:CBS domain-containing protein [Nonomuraea sp. MG754425]MCF6467876.1 CBS domain-containing protein [Nonomuraea sp. MG754425]
MRVKVQDIMTTEVVSVNGSTPFKDIAEVLMVHGVNAVPVVDVENRFLSVTSEADLLRKEECHGACHTEGHEPPLRARLPDEGPDRQRKAVGTAVEQRMTAPAVAVRPPGSPTNCCLLSASPEGT